MCKLNKKNDGRRIDPCMRNIIECLQQAGVDTLACCCGHGKYPMSIIINIGFGKILALEIFSNLQIPRKKRFYKRDKEGYYFIPEVISKKCKKYKIN